MLIKLPPVNTYLLVIREKVKLCHCNCDGGKSVTSQTCKFESRSKSVAYQSRYLWDAPVMVQDLTNLLSRLCPKLLREVGLNPTEDLQSHLA